MRRLLIAGNWKMHGGLSMTSELITGIATGLQQLSSPNQFDVLVCPPSALLATARQAIGGAEIRLGGQNMHSEVSGAYTGEISGQMLVDLGCDYVLLGHSERRELFAESDDFVADKFAACVATEGALIPVLCVGETLDQRQADETENVLAKQLDAVVKKIGIAGFENAVIAYEPVWAIGTGETASPEQAQAAHAFIRGRLADSDRDVADGIQILYGGSMKPENAKNLLSQPDIDGGLIGGAALKADSFVAICEAAADVSSG